MQLRARIDLPTQNIMLTILNALLLACAKSSIGSMQVGFLMALAKVSVGGLFNNVGYWQRTKVPCACQRAERTKKSNPEKSPMVAQPLFRGDVV
jgi:hypothetical protein